MSKSDTELRSIRDSVAFVGRMSDSLVKVGPFNLGLGGVLAWAPGIGELYSSLAGGFIVVQGARAGVPVATLAAASALLLLRTSAIAIPLAGDLFADVFTAHKWAAAMVVRAIDRRLGSMQDTAGPTVEGSWQVRPGKGASVLTP